MEIKIDKQRQHHLFLSIPALLAILISGIIDVQILANHPLSSLIGDVIKNPVAADVIRRLLWNILQLIPAYLFGSLSDTYLRRDYLIYVQIFGVIFGLVFLIIGFKSWVIFLFAMTYNPLSVARAALLDNYKKVTSIEIISTTYIFKYLPWVFIVPLTRYPIQSVFYFLVPILALNVLFTIFLFRDRFDTKKKMEKFEELHKEEKASFIRGNKWAILLNVIAFALAETTFYLFWTYLEEIPSIRNLLFLSTLLTISGLLLVLLYRRSPTISTVAKLYGTLILSSTVLAIILFVLNYSPKEFLIVSMICNCVIGGIYISLSTGVLIELSGTKRRATGSAFAETADVIALFGASLFYTLGRSTALIIFLEIVFLYLLATLIQSFSKRFVKLNIDSI
jgi:hypothetical protein